ncbi:methyltransferase [Mycolicibacterium agri]|uniref:O-methyltransferase n=1 Tax=Mycolicibacterium agri TaxID=36811 RepID=A0A7I9W3A8_MYCAG|nr:methyltransferase [Mycolicibacterium agri]GFG51686.1 O-methyltransferase [Mycolicibacterium agri]
MAPSDDAHHQMAAMIFGYWISQALGAYASLSIADHLADGPLTAAEVAQRECSAPEATFRLMRAGLTLGLLTSDCDGRFRATELLDTLRRDAPRSLRDVALSMTGRMHWQPWGEFAAAVRTGESQARKMLGLPIFDYMQKNPHVSVEFTAAMTGLTALWKSDVVDRLNTDGVTLAVDVGGASGALLRQLREANPALRGIVFDRPDVAAAIADDLEGIGDGIEVVGGDFFEALPAADLYLLKLVLHDWDDESCVKILRRCREAMAPGGRIAVIDFLIEDARNPGFAALMDLNMLAMATGKERTVEDFDALLANADLRRCGLQTTDSYAIIEAVGA